MVYDNGGKQRIVNAGDWAWAGAVAPSGRWLVSGGRAELRIWPLRDGSLFPEMKLVDGGSMSFVRCATSRDDGVVASAGDDWGVSLWDCSSGRFASKLGAHGAPVRGLDAADGNIYISGADDGHVRIWDRRNPGRPVGAPGGASMIAQVRTAKLRGSARGIHLTGVSSVSIDCNQVRNLVGSKWGRGQLCFWDGRKNWSLISKVSSVGHPTALSLRLQGFCRAAHRLAQSAFGGRWGRLQNCL